MVAQHAPPVRRYRSRQQEMAEWIEQRVRELASSGQTVVLPFVTDEAMEHFGEIPGFMDDLLREAVRTTVGRIVSLTVGRSRHRTGITYIAHGEVVAPREVVRAAIARKTPRWMGRMEHLPESRQHKQLGDMTRVELEEAAGERERRGNMELSLARLWRRMGRQMDDGETVKQRFSDTELELMYQKLIQEQEDVSKVV